MHLADRIVLMKNGRIAAQGTYEDLKTDNEDFQAILKVHAQQQVENSAVGSQTSTVTANFSPITKCSTLKGRLATFSGSTKVGKLVKREDEDTDDDDVEIKPQVVKRLIQYYGGYTRLVLIVALIMAMKAFETKQRETVLNWASMTGESQRAGLTDYLKGMVVIVLANCFLEASRGRIISRITRGVTKVLHNSILAKIIRAPVNLFFDVTPLGKIMKRFQSDLGDCCGFVHSIGEFADVIIWSLATMVIAFTTLPVIILPLFVLVPYAYKQAHYKKLAFKQWDRMSHLHEAPMQNHLHERQRG